MKAGEREVDEPAHRSLGRQVLGCGEGVKAIRRELVDGYVVSDVAGLRGVAEERADHVTESVFGVRDVLVTVEQSGELGVVVAV
jgi:hypothetical protein